MRELYYVYSTVLKSYVIAAKYIFALWFPIAINLKYCYAVIIPK